MFFLTQCIIWIIILVYKICGFQKKLNEKFGTHRLEIGRNYAGHLNFSFSLTHIHTHTDKHLYLYIHASELWWRRPVSSVGQRWKVGHMVNVIFRSHCLFVSAVFVILHAHCHCGAQFPTHHYTHFVMVI